MGARKWHVARAEHHLEVGQHLQGRYEDWAAVALAYSALHYVHSSLADEPALLKDERHPRKHTAPAGAGNGGRGTNQLVRDLYPSIHVQYRSLLRPAGAPATTSNSWARAVGSCCCFSLRMCVSTA